MPAMPIRTPDGSVYPTGLTKLEHFAGLAMQGLLANSMMLSSGKTISSSEMSEASVAAAKALLKALENQK